MPFTVFPVVAELKDHDNIQYVCILSRNIMYLLCSLTHRAIALLATERTFSSTGNLATFDLLTHIGVLGSLTGT